MTDKVCSFNENKCSDKITKYNLCEVHLADPYIEPHHCHFCGEYVVKGYTSEGKQHYLSDCRPDLVKHEIGKSCTWYGCEHRNKEGKLEPIKPDCYAYAEDTKDGRVWGTEHIHFHEDGPM